MILFQYRKQPWHEEYLNFFGEGTWLYTLLVLLIIFFILRRTKKEFHSHWNTLIPDFTYLSKDFYAQFKKELLSHGIESISTSFVTLSEGGITSSKRMYLRILWKNYQYDICCAPFGDGLFLSSWVLYRTSIGQLIISRIPFMGGWLTRRLYKITYYKIDTASMFQTYCHQTMMKILDEITKDSVIRISDADRKPILKDIFKR